MEEYDSTSTFFDEKNRLRETIFGVLTILMHRVPPLYSALNPPPLQKKRERENGITGICWI